jgi:perosamine synthetase
VSRVPVAGPWITQREIDYATEAATHGWYERAGEFPARFEKAFAAWIGVRHAVSLPSCTSGIHLALAAAGVKAGDEVIVPDLTWIASAAPISYVGATPVFADVDRETWCVTEASVRARLTPRTRAILPVDLYGSMPPLVELRALAEERGLFLLEDAAEGMGSTLGGKQAGSFGHAAVFSFHGSKTLTTGEGGMFVTGDDELFSRALFLRDHGRAPGPKMFWNSEVAFKYKMSPVQAAIGLAQVERAEELVAKKRQIFAWYAARLPKWIQLNAEPPGVRNSYWMVTVVLPPREENRKERVIAALGAQGIDARPFFYPLSTLPAYEGSEAARVARAEHAASHEWSAYGLNLPCALRLEEADVTRVCEALLAIAVT